MITRIGYDSIRQLTYILPTALTDEARDVARCPTCGRADNCICSGCTLCVGPKRRPAGLSDDALQRIMEEL